MATMTLIHGTTEYVPIPVSERVAGVVQDPTSNAVSFAFRSLGDSTDPASLAYSDGEWETDTTTSPPTYMARRLVGPGPGGLNLPAGAWRIFLKITSDPERPIVDGGLLVLTG